MKKILTLLFCVTALSASAANPVDECVNVLLGNTAPATLMATNLDANGDGAITIVDVALLIDQQLQAEARSASVDAIVQDALNGNPPTHNVNDVTEAIEQNLKSDQQ